MGSTAAVLQVLGSLASTGVSAYQLANPAPTAGAGMKLPSVLPTTPTDPTTANRALLPSARADAASRVGGGMSPEFLANLLGQESGSPEGALSILGDIRKTLGPGQGI